MSGELGKDFRESAPELELLLWALWNPLGFNVPLDEYGRYVPQIWKLLEQRADVTVIAAELEGIERDWMAIDKFGDPRGAAVGDVRDVAERLSDWWSWRFDHPEPLAKAERTA